MYRSNKQRFIKRAGLSTVIAVAALATGAGIAGASTHAPSNDSSSSSADGHSSRDSRSARSAFAGGHQQHRAPGGIVTAVSSTSLTVQDRAGKSMTFTLNSSTAVNRERTTAALVDLAVGEHVRIVPSAPGSTTASGVEIELANIAGKVVSVSGETITISNREGANSTIVVSGSTRSSSQKER
jgi:hypothetical protein